MTYWEKIRRKRLVQKNMKKSPDGHLYAKKPEHEVHVSLTKLNIASVQDDLNQSFSKQVANLRKGMNHRQDIHMKIITMHHAETVRENIFLKIRQRFIDYNKTKKAKQSCFAKLFYYCEKKFEKLMQEQSRYQNVHMIDDYVDNYWIFNCPNHYSIQQSNKCVHDFFHQLFTQDTQEMQRDLTVNQTALISKMEQVKLKLRKLK
jgi:hypothetical protein